MRVTLSIASGPNAGDVFIFEDHATFLVGRSSEAHVKIGDEDIAVSRYHFLIEINPPYARLLDLESRNGTFVNQKRTFVANLKNRDIIQVGLTRIDVFVELNEPVEMKEFPGSGDSFACEAPNIEGYQVESELGRGRLGVTYLARKLDDEERVTIRALWLALKPTDRILAEFFQIAAEMPKCPHPQIPSVRKILSQNKGNSAYLRVISDYAEGQSLEELLFDRDHQPIDLEQAIQWIAELLDLLAVLHDQGLIHGAVQPSNIIVTSEPEALKKISLLDFGLGPLFHDSRLGGISILNERNINLSFSAPERIIDYPCLAPAIDLYAAGAVFYQLVTGLFTHESHDRFEKRVLALLQDQPTPLSKRRPEISFPPSLEEWVAKSLARKPSDRFEDAREMKTSLIKAANREGEFRANEVERE